MQTVKSKQEDPYYLAISDIGIKRTDIYFRYVIDQKFEQRKRRALLTIIFLAYPFFAQ